jgi:hypothetical protein
MDRRPVPDDPPFRGYLPKPAIEEPDAIHGLQRMVPHPGVEAASRREAADDREGIARREDPPFRRLPPWPGGPDRTRQAGDARLSAADQSPSLAFGPLCKSGQTSARPRAISSSSRGMAQTWGICGVPSRRFRSREPWAL